MNRLPMFQNQFLRNVFLTAAALCLCLCRCAHDAAPANPSADQSLPSAQGGGQIHARNQGYSLLYRLMSDESDVNKILIIKDVDPALKDVITQISTAASSAKEQLDDYQKQDGHSEFDVPDLPRAEQEARDLEAKVDEKELVFSSGKTFELRLILTQLQALRYGQQLCDALIPMELAPQRKAMLTNLAAQLGQYHDRLIDLIAPK